MRFFIVDRNYNENNDWFKEYGVKINEFVTFSSLEEFAKWNDNIHCRFTLQSYSSLVKEGRDFVSREFPLLREGDYVLRFETGYD